MLKKNFQKKKNPLSRAQNRLLKESLKRLLGDGLVQEPELKEKQLKQIILKDALNAINLE